MKQITLGLIAFWIIAACTITPVTPTVVPEPTSTAPPTATLAPAETATPAPTATPLAYRNLTSQFAWLAEPAERFEGVSFLVKGTVVGSQVTATFTGRFTEQPTGSPGGGWYIWASPDFRPAFTATVEVGSCVFQRGYRQRGLTGGSIWWEQVPEDGGEWVLRPKYSTAANKNGRADLIYPFSWEIGDWWSCTITYERVGGG